MNKYIIEIKENNTIEIFLVDNPLPNNAPIIRQDVHPDGRAWESREEAENWANQLIAKWTIPPAEEEIIIEDEVPTE